MESSEHAIELNSDDANSYYMLGLSQKKIGLYHLALEHFETYLSLVDHELPKEQKFISYAQKRVEELRGYLTDTSSRLA